MNPKDVLDIKKRLDEVSISVEDLRKIINGLKLNNPSFIKCNPPINPNIAPKIAYDANGLVIKGMKLDDTDIPELSIDKIKGLRKIIDTQISSNEIISLRESVSRSVMKNKPITPGTGTKVNYDKNGLITSSTNLVASDIPPLPIDHIVGLTEVITVLESHSTDGSVENRDPISPGTFPVITFDSDGKVVRGTKLSMDDIPIGIINKLNMFESMVSSFATQSTVNTILRDMQKVAFTRDDVTPGTYTRVTVDRQGLITSGGQITIADFPDITVDDIPGLSSILRNKANQSDLVSLQNDVSIFISSNVVTDIKRLELEINDKVSSSELIEVNRQIGNFRRALDSIQGRLPNELINEELVKLREMLTVVTGEVVAIQRRLNMETSFCTNPENIEEAE